MESVNGKHIWVIGASSGIGAALVRELHAQGAKLTLSARRADKLEELNAGIGGAHKILPLDVADRNVVHEAVKTVNTHFGDGVDSVLFMAAIYSPGNLMDSDLDTVHKAIDVNIGGAMSVVYESVPTLKKGSQIVLCASVAGYRGLPNGQPYCATKAAMINFAESLKTDLDPHGIDVKVICPGFVRTPLTNQNDFDMPMMIEADEAAKEIVKGMISKTFEIHFPKKFTRLVKILNFLPYPVFFTVMKKIAEKWKVNAG